MNVMNHLIFMYKFKNAQLPENFFNYFRKNESKRYSLRSNNNDNFWLPLKQSKYTEHSISYRGPQLWNNITDNEIRNSKTLISFKKKLKSYILNN